MHRHQISRSFKTFTGDSWDNCVSDLVFGATTGVVTTFIGVAAIVGANQPVVMAMVLGLANLAAIGFATAARRYGNVKSGKASKSWHAKTAQRIQNHDASELVSSPSRTAVNTFAAFILFGLIPLITYLLAPNDIRMYRGDRLCALCHRLNQRPLYTDPLVAIRVRHAASWNVFGCTGLCRRPQSAARHRRVVIRPRQHLRLVMHQ
jgi:hypothetical protein